MKRASFKKSYKNSYKKNSMKKSYQYCYTSLLVLSLLGCASNPTSNTPTQTNPMQETFPSKEATNLTQGLRPSDIELGLMSQLIGQWDVQDWQLRKDGQWQPLNGAVWTFKAIQNGRAVQDEWYSFAADGKTPAGHVNALRIYNPSNKTWQAAWLSSRNGRLDNYLGLQTDGEIIFTASAADNGRLTRQVFSNLNPQSFQWRIEWSKDQGQTWLPVYRVQATRR